MRGSTAVIVWRGPSRDPLQRSLDVLAELAGRGLARAGLRRMGLYERHLSARGTAAGERESLVHHWLDPSGVARLAAARGQDPRELLTRLDRGDRCFGATDRGRVVAARWVSRGSVEVSFLRAGLRLGSCDAWVWDSWTDPARRGTGVARAGSAELGLLLQREGVRRLVAAVMVGNRPGRAAVLGSGYRRLGTITSVRTAGARRVGFRARRQA